jgi:hypothetical protein
MHVDHRAVALKVVVEADAVMWEPQQLDERHPIGAASIKMRVQGSLTCQRAPPATRSVSKTRVIRGGSDGEGR